MIYPPDLLDVLQSSAASAWSGTVYRHMFGSYSPARGNTTGARWNDAGLEAIYTSCERETALAEAEYYIAAQPLRPRAKRTLYAIKLSLKNVIDLTAPALLLKLGITTDVLSSSDHSMCRVIGGAVSWLGHDGLLVPSARRASGTNLVIYKQDLSTTEFEIVAEEVIAEDKR
ncbi:MAG TPA: RES family NAD+ phosphorylase [Thermoanaerobaculia bacterium]|nr:RES family NAD+ phosphorylase [Thermoanaerobaculia bacterium]